MRVCFIAEGCYPYVVGGVSSWINTIIRSFSDIEYSILAILPDRSYRGNFKYEIPPNVVEIRETYINDVDWGHGTARIDQIRKRFLPKDVYRELRELFMGGPVQWDVVFDYFQKRGCSLNELLMGVDHYLMVRDLYDRDYPESVFSDFLWTMRSVYLPVFQTLSAEVPQADIYHCVSTGYAGLLGCIGQHMNGAGLILSEHGIYTREREEELIRADWAKKEYKELAIQMFKVMAKLAYDRASRVVSLFEKNRELQIEFGCPPEKAVVIPNGISPAGLTEAEPPESDHIDISAIVRLVPIKDIQTMIHAFAMAKQSAPQLRLWIMGPDDEDPSYAKDCYELVDNLEVEDVIFTGRVQVKDYLPRMRFTVLTSISEGQPLVILESFAAKKPVISTDVGNCHGLLYGEGDDTLGAAGILTHIMNVREIADAMVDLAGHPKKTKRMGEVGYERLHQRYLISYMKEAYAQLYQQVWEEVKDHGGHRDHAEQHLSS